jgi:ectoine hydroxylase-related dioxygenase (phytanoyl-CoA dioxygenase family)
MKYDELNADGQRQVMKVEYYTDFHPGIQGLFRESPFLELLGQLSGEPMCLFKDKINYKAPKGNGFLAHLDYSSSDSAQKPEHLTALIAVDENSMENGALEVVPGSHKMKWEFDEEWAKKCAPNPCGILSKEWEAGHEWTPALLKPGDVLFFGSHLAHRSGNNNSNKSRCSVYATFCATANDGIGAYKRYYDLRRQLYPPEYERDEDKDYSKGFAIYAPAGTGEILTSGVLQTV